MPQLKMPAASFSSSVPGVNNVDGELYVHTIQNAHAHVGTSKSDSASTPSTKGSLNQAIFQNLKRDLHISSPPNRAASIYQASNIEQAANFQPAEMINDTSHRQGECFSFFSNSSTRLCFKLVGMARPCAPIGNQNGKIYSCTMHMSYT
ncbi:hypothetical protein BDA96_09G088300 [Sorghum bicolor]|uniref:Uncharacterized protein n=1 Tax=Sorghum bicolor TaxID=4558 RepID=A0A921QBN7_SORBI|nr:hypothetical protein BDA96_09G088300 [Sorghum bicolor]